MNLSIFFPAFNEEENLRQTIETARSILNKLGLANYEIIIINDGSTDRTGEVAEALVNIDPTIRVIHHNKNEGYGAALKTGLYAAKYEWIAFTDADGQYDFSEIQNFLEKSNSADIVIGYRARRADSLIRKINTRLFNIEMFLLFGLQTKDVDCGFKLLKKEVLDRIAPLQSDGALIEAELLIKAQKIGFRIAQIPVTHFPREAGKQTGANLRVIWKGAVIEPIKLWWTLHMR
ncbi:glycosyltransferase family 2 protein [Patescibacteria group bacterium]|nr:glycosyltransferase family 2 protein [Patescibacteria group bacterium]MBU1868161.1 glycosyltransferase family 2 protein [Patescibacteria group bacterium]